MPPLSDILFYLFAALTVVCSLLVVLKRNPVNSAMFLVLAMICLAALFVLLHAFFISAVQIIVYAGAVLILFVFVIMLLDLQEEQRRQLKAFGIVTGVASVGALGYIFTRSVAEAKIAASPQLAQGSTYALGKLLFTDYTLPFEILSVLLLSAMVGVILLSKKDLK